MAVLLCGCTTTETTDNNGEIIEIGAIIPLTGDLNSPGTDLQRGMDIAAAELNEKGGIKGLPVNIIYKDNRGDPELSSELVMQCADRGIKTVLGGLTSENTLAMVPVAEKEGIILVSPSATSGKLSDYSYVYRTIGSNRALGIAMASAVRDLKQKPESVAVIYLNDSYGGDLIHPVTEALEDQGNDIVYTAGFLEGSGNISVDFDEMYMKNPGAVILISRMTDAPEIVNRIRESVPEIPIVCSETLQLDELIERTGSNAEGIYSVAPFWKPGGEELHRKYQEKYAGENMNYLTAYGYDTLMVIADAMKRQGTSPDAVLKGLDSCRYFDVSGLKVFTGSGDLQWSLFNVWQVSDGSWTRLKQLYFVHEPSDKSVISSPYSLNSGNKGTKETYKIGVILPLSGDLSEYGLSSKEGIDVAVKEINSGSFIEGIFVEVIYRDNAGSKEKTKAIAEDFAASGIPVVIGSSASDATIALAETAEEKQFIMISPSASTQVLSDYKDFVYRTIGSDSAHAGTLAVIVAHDPDVSSPAVVYTDNAYGNGFKDAFIADYEKTGRKVAVSEKILPGQTDFSNQIEAVSASGANALVLISLADEGLEFLDAFTGYNGDMPVYVTEGMNVDAFFEILGSRADGIYMTVPDMDTPTKFTDVFIDNYMADYGKKVPNYYVQSGYDTMMVIADSVNRGGYSVDGIINGLDDCRYYGLTGEKEFDDAGDIDPLYTLLQAKNGSWERINKYELDNLVITYV